MKIWFDTEFIDDGRTIDLVSIGMVREDGAIYYAENSDADLSKACEWVCKNVITHLTGNGVPRNQIRDEVLEFAGENPEFWAYFASYDWIALCQLFGRMIDLPGHWPMFCMDIKQRCWEIGNPRLPGQTGRLHNALDDALWNREAHEFLEALAHG